MFHSNVLQLFFILFLFFCMSIVTYILLFHDANHERKNFKKNNNIYKFNNNATAQIIETDILIVGAGLSGAVVAQRYAEEFPQLKITIIDKRNHIGGNCYDYIDEETGIRVNKYGVHLFHTNNQRVWNYLQRFSHWTRWDHFVLGYVNHQYVPIPVGIRTVNMLFNESLSNENEMNEWLKINQIHISTDPKNSEEMALSRVGQNLYEKIFLPYTLKQWDKHPKDMDSEVTARIPVRNNFDERYFTDKYQALPTDGYTKIFENMLNYPNIKILLGVDFFDVKINAKKKIFYTGPIDSFLKISDQYLEPLEYRSLRFERKVFYNHPGYAQPCSQVNFPSLDYPYTRIIEYKWLLNQKSKHTVIFKEFSDSKGEPYYPVPNVINKDRYKNMQLQFLNMEKNNKIVFLGRLANYKYFNMDEAILNALKVSDENIVEEKDHITYERRYRRCIWIKQNIKNEEKLIDIFTKTASASNELSVFRISSRMNQNPWGSDFWNAVCSFILETVTDVVLHVVPEVIQFVPIEFKHLVIENTPTNMNGNTPGWAHGDVIMSHLLFTNSHKYNFTWGFEDDCRYTGFWRDVLAPSSQTKNDLIYWNGQLFSSDFDRNRWWHQPQYYHGKWKHNLPRMVGGWTMGFGISLKLAKHILSNYYNGTFVDHQEVNLFTNAYDMEEDVQILKLESLDELWECCDLGKSQQTYEDWKNGKITIPQNRLMHPVKLYSE